MTWMEWAENNRLAILQLAGGGRELEELKSEVAKLVPDEIGGCKKTAALLSIYKAVNNHCLKIKSKDKKTFVVPIIAQ